MDSQFDIVDFHTHVLPGVDHGCDSLDTALKQLKLAKSACVSRVLITPHFYPHIDDVIDFTERRDKEYSALCSATDGFDEYPDIRLGCEVLLCEGISGMQGIDKLCIAGTRTILLELPFSDFSKRYVDDVENLISLGYDVVMAHVERYSPSKIEEFISVGAKLQINADALCGLFIPKTLKLWLAGGYAVALGSDIHMLDKRAYKSFARARKLICKKYKGFSTESDRIWQDSEKQLKTELCV